MKVYRSTFQLFILLLCGLVSNAVGQVPQVKVDRALPLPDGFTASTIFIQFAADVLEINGVPPPTSAGAAPVPPPTIHFITGGTRIRLTCQVRTKRDLAGDVVTNGVELFNFRTEDLAAHPVNLVTGSTDDGGAAVPRVPDGQKRIYYIVWEAGKIKGQSSLLPIFAFVEVGAAAANLPSLIAVKESENEIGINPTGIDKSRLLAALRTNPNAVTVVYKFGRNDPAINFEEQAQSVGDKPTAPGEIIVNIGRRFPARPEEYTVALELPTSVLGPLLENGFAIPAAEKVVAAELTINKPPPPNERSKTEFFFESTFSSIVNATNRKRANVGLFALHLKPVIGLRFFNVGDSGEDGDEHADLQGGSGKRPQWIAFRPLFDADVDTQPMKNSQAANRIVFGMDFEWGISAGRQERGKMRKIQQYVFLNGIRYDSDRDFNLQTLYWHTEFMPRFLNFIQTRDQRLRQFRFPNGDRAPERARLFPAISSYHVRPSVGYQLGGIIKRDDVASPFPTDMISRLFGKLGAGIEFRRLVQFTLDDTYYFLQNASRRRNRNYLEARLDFNTGALFNVDLGSLQSAFTIKFQRGDVPPRFKSVNAFSIGFKLYR